MTKDDINEDFCYLLRKLKIKYPALRYTQIISMCVGRHMPWYKNPDIFYCEDGDLLDAMIKELRTKERVS